MSDQRDLSPYSMGNRWSTVNPRLAAEIRKRRIEIATDPATGQKRITIR